MLRKVANMLRDIVVFLCEKLEKFSRYFAVDHRRMGSSGLMRDKWLEDQRQFEYMKRLGDIDFARNDRTNEK